MRNIARCVWGGVLVLILLAIQPLAAQSVDEAGRDWPQFLGPARNGVSKEQGLFTTWPESGPPVVWRATGGVGMSGLAVADGKLLTLIQTEGQQSVLALDALSGKMLWKTPVAPAYENQMGDGPRATPTISGDRVFVFTGEGILAAFQLESGAALWKVNVFAELGGKPAEYGMASSPLVAGESVVIQAGADRGAVTAFHRESGKFQWASGAGTAGYSSPALLKVGGREQIVAFAGKAAYGIDPATGKEWWKYPYKTDYDCNIAVPVAWEGQVFLSAGENHGCVLLSIEPAGDAMRVQEVWQSFGKDSVMRNEWQTSVVHGGYLYGLDNVGSAGPVTHFNCVELATGKRVWQKLRFGKGNLIAADGKLFVAMMSGELVVLAASPEGYQELGRAKVIGSTRQAPTLADGRLYLRDDREIVCLDVRK